MSRMLALPTRHEIRDFSLQDVSNLATVARPSLSVSLTVACPDKRLQHVRNSHENIKRTHVVHRTNRIAALSLQRICTVHSLIPANHIKR
jgi:hypothetical protein